MSYYDAHCHVRDGLGPADTSVVNGTSPRDWGDVIQAGRNSPKVIPAIGLHPWKVDDAPEDWQAQFAERLDQVAAIGEIGLDRHVEDRDHERQEAAFCWQLEQAAERNLPVSIHCLKAGDVLLRILNEHPAPRRGIHLHAFSGSAQEARQLVERGAYFSFHAGQFKAQAKKAPAAVKAIPVERLLLETDAPDTLNETEEAPDFLRRAYERAAELRGMELNELAEQVAANFKRYFLDD
jgi:TatD DNase family protein